MILKSILALAGFILCLGPVRSDDFIKQALGENSPLVKVSSDHRIKVTLLYLGPVHDAQIQSAFVLVYLQEDCRSDEEYERHHITFSKDGYETGGGEYYLQVSTPEIKDHSHRLLTDSAQERARGYDGAPADDFKALYPTVKVPAVDHPKRAGIYEFFFKSVATGPFDVTLHDHFEAYGENSFHFRDVDFTFSSGIPSSN